MKNMIGLIHHQQGTAGNKKTSEYKIIKNCFCRSYKKSKTAQRLPAYNYIIQNNCIAGIFRFVFY